jgi:hypothetical protein
MAITVRALLRSIAGLVAVLVGASRPSIAQDRVAPGTMAALIAKLRSDLLLRGRFLENPGGVMREQGIDPTPFRLPERLTQEQLDRLLADWSRQAGPQQAPKPTSPQGPTPASPQPQPPAVVYGPPAGPPRTQTPQPRPPAPVYGPPAGPPR